MAVAAASQSRPVAADFVGRHYEMRELHAGLAEALAGRSRLFLVTGEPGIGKSRIAREIAATAERQEIRVAWGASSDAAGAPPYWPWVQISRALVRASAPLRTVQNPPAPEIDKFIGRAGSCAGAPIAEPLAPELARFRLFEAVSGLLRDCAATRPLLLILDDLHEAGQPSWLMLRFIAREIRDARLMVVVTYRELEANRDPGLLQVIADLLRAGSQLSLGGLSEAEIAQFVEQRTGRQPGPRLVSELRRATGGNPFFVTEVVRSLIATAAPTGQGIGEPAAFTIPESVRASIAGRLAALPEPAERVLAAAAALGGRFQLGPLQRVCEAQADELMGVLDAASAAEIVVPAAEGGMRYRFSHALVRDAVYERLDAARRLRLHHRILRVLEELYRAEPDAHLDELAYHAVAAAPLGGREMAIAYAIRAGEAAHATFAYEQAAQHWQAALTLLEEDGGQPLRLAALLERLGAVLSITEFSRPKGIECLERAAAIYERAGRKHEGAQARARLALMLSRRAPAMDIRRAMAEFRRAERVLGRLPDNPSQVWLYSGLAAAAMQAHRTEEGLAAARRALEVATRLGDQPLWLQAAVRYAESIFDVGRLAEAAALIERAWQEADRLNDPNASFEAAWSGGYFELALWNPRAAQRWFARELAQPRLADAPYQRQILLQQIAFCHVFTGDLERARGLLAHAPRALIEGFIPMCDGAWTRADELLDAAREAMRAAGSHNLESVHCFFQAVVRRTAGNLQGAEAAIERALELSLQGHASTFELVMRTEAALIALAAGRREAALAHAARCREIMAAGEDFGGHAGRVALAECLAAAGGGITGSVERSLADAIEVFRSHELVWEEAQAHRLWAKALLGAGQRRRANEHFDKAMKIYRRHSAGTPWFELIVSDRQAARSDEPPAPFYANHPGGAHTAKGDDFAHRRADEGAQTAVFRREGDYWTILFRGSLLRFRNTNGLNYLSHLLSHCAQSVPAAVLARCTEAAPRPARLTRRSGSAAERTSGRDNAGRSSERARVMVTKGIRSAILRIRQSDPALGRHLATRIRTGYSCIYEPDPDDRIVCRVGRSLPQ